MVAIFNFTYLWLRRTDLFGDENFLELCVDFRCVNYEKHINKEIMKSIFMMVIISIFLDISSCSIYIEGMLGPMMAISISDSRQKMVYDVDLIFLFVLKLGMIFFSMLNQTGGYFFIGNINQLFLYFLPSIFVYFISNILVKIGGMGCGDPIIFSGLCVGMTWMELAHTFFGSFILAGVYCLIAFFIDDNLGDRIGLGPFICMAYIFVCFLMR